MAFDRATRQHILDTVDRLVRERVVPRAAAIDREDAFPRDLWQAAAEAGLFGLGIPEEYGGLGRDFVTPLLISERIARVSAAFALTFNNTTDSAVPIVAKASAPMKEKFLPRLARGELVPCISFTEPQGGSDMAAMRTRAERVAGGYRINGRKMWCTNGVVGDVFTVFAKTDPEAGHRGITAFLVERGAQGFAIGRTESLIGLRGSPVTELIFEDVFVTEEARLGEEGEGFRIGVITLDESRLHCAATALGVAAAALDYALAYARDRVQFGKPIVEHQGLQFLIAECATELAAARALWERTTELILERHDRRASTLAAMTKLICSDLSMKITTEAVQIMGGAGLSNAHPVERFMRDAKAFQIYDGTSQIQKSIIGRQLAKDGLPFDHLSVAGM
ncbi:MAG: acyl-CoA dehydrogenase family protein [Alphaproteobacteria bacterium]